jgi:hypothetical protein
MYHEKRIALVNNFVCLVPLKNIVQGRKGYSKVEKRFPWEISSLRVRNRLFSETM